MSSSLQTEYAKAESESSTPCVCTFAVTDTATTKAVLACRRATLTCH